MTGSRTGRSGRTRGSRAPGSWGAHLPQCAAVVGAVLDALSAPAGAGDLRTHGQRYHDALQDAMRWLRKCIVICVTSAHAQIGRRSGCQWVTAGDRSSLMARMTDVGGSDLAARGWTGLRGRSALQVLGSAAAALDRLPRGAEQAASGESCG